MTKFLIFISIIMGIAYTPVLYSDISAYYSNVNNGGCCGWVENSILKRPFTHIMIEEWTEPKWTTNGNNTEQWLTTDGLVNGKVEFWKIIEVKKIK